ncbi:MAG: folate-binding protein YgfZ [Frankiales bacterium]|nr:folate-binding protein YgfZ [Frankiales bacterium]
MTAVPADPPDQDVAAHYGDPYAEQRALSRGEGVVDLSNRDVLRVTGPDRLSWLHSLVSQHVERLQPGERTQALVLSPQGHVEHHLHLLETGEDVLIHVEPGTGAALREFLDRMRFMLRVEVTAADGLVVQWTPGAGHELVPDTTGTAGRLAFDALRIAEGTPRLGLDTDHRTLPHEVGWLGSAVHLDKGCYRGQETVARVWNLGKPPRRLVRLHLDGSDSELPALASDVLLEGRAVGRMGSSARHFEDGPIGLALLKRNVPTDAALVVDGVAASIEELTFDEPVSPARASADARADLLRFR